MNTRDCRDTASMVIFALAFAASVVYIFLHPTDINFATWAGLTATMGGIFHWLCIYDDKKKDE